MFTMLTAGQRQQEASAFAPERSGHNRYWSTEDGTLGSSSVRRTEGSLSEAVAAVNRPLPRDSKTCILWCAISLGALVRGCPLADVGVPH